MKQPEGNKPTKKLPFYKTFFGALLSILAICVVLYFAFFASLDFITGHGRELKVPNLTGKKWSEVGPMLTKQGFDVIIDSTYEPEKPQMTVLDQQPLPGNTVKAGRHIFLTLNKTTPPNSSMPNLVNLSFRSAKLVLKSNKLLVGDTTTIPDMPKGVVIGQLYNGNYVTKGTQIPQGSKINLEIGGGVKKATVVVPDVLHLTYDVAVSILNASNLDYDVVWEGKITDTSNAVIIYQLPEGFDQNQNPVSVEQGTRIDLRAKQEM